jgi:2-dehydro-3-deoxyglucarate aldolase/4-hydroxy-2-oxoheptanedioate aldolase
MKKENIKYRLVQGDIIRGCMLSELSMPSLARMFHGFGFEFLIVDCEHGYFDMAETANLIAVASGYDFPIIIRIAQGNQKDATRYLDMGADGIMLANVNSAIQVEELVRLCLYAPEGDRGVSTFRAHTNYCSSDIMELMKKANKKNLVIAQIESTEAVELIDNIAAIPGLDGFVLGPNDFSQRIGFFGQYDHPIIDEAIKKMEGAAKKYGKWSGVVTNNEKLLRRCRAAGMRFFSAGSELSMLAAGANTTMKMFENLVK